MTNRHEFSVDELYRAFGRFDNVATFIFRDRSDAQQAYGPYITGMIRYRPSDRERLRDALENEAKSGLPQVVKLGWVFPDTERSVALDLRRHGFSCEDIQHCEYVPWHTEDKFTQKGPRQLPNVIKVKVDTSQFMPGDRDNMVMNLYERHLTTGWQLIDEEKFELVGLYAALDNGAVPGELLEAVDLEPESVKGEDRVLFHFYESKARRNTISQEERVLLQQLKVRRMVQRLQILAEEMTSAFGDIRKTSIDPEKMDVILRAAMEFIEERVLFVQCPIYWDFRSYAHIYLRHVKETQIGGVFEGKTVLPYSHTDIKDLIRRVLETISTDIKEHFAENPGTRFSRHGNMAVEFNGDYYTIDIARDGRIENFFCSA